MKKHQLIFCISLFFIGYPTFLQAQHDIGILSIVTPDTSSCFFSNNDTVKILVKNFGTFPEDSINFSYQLFDGTFLSESYNDTLQPGDSILYTFNETVDLSKSYNNSIIAWVDTPLDTIGFNDSLYLPLQCICYSSSGTPYVCNQLVVKYQSTATNVAIDSIRNQAINAGIKILDSTGCDGIYLDIWLIPDLLIWNGTTIINLETQKEEIVNSSAGMEGADLNFVVDGNQHFTKNNFLKNTETIGHLNKGNPSESPIKITILDTGIDTTLSIFTPYKWRDSCSTCFNTPIYALGYDFINDDFDPSDDNFFYGGHGTQIASIIAKYANDYNLNVKIIPLKVLDHLGMGSLWEISLGVLSSRQIDADIINASFGWQGDSSYILQQLIELAGAKCHGIFISSAGNDGVNNDTIPHWPSNYTKYLDNVIAVTSLNNNSTTELADYANYGFQTVDIAAPGNFSVTQINGSLGTAVGTSFSAAFITAQTAQMLNNEPNTTALQAKKGMRWIGSRYHPPIVRPDDYVLVYGVLVDNDSLLLKSYTDTITIDPNCTIYNCTTTSTFEPNFPPTLLDLKTYPNPFSERIVFEFQVETSTTVNLTIYDVTGKLVFSKQQTMEIGIHQMEWNGKQNGIEVPNGIYVAHFQTSKGKGSTLFVKQK